MYKAPKLHNIISGFLEKLVVGFSGFLLFIMMIHVVLDVFGRYLFGQPIIGTLEIVSNYYMVAIVFLPLAVVQMHDGHVKVEVFTMWFSPRATIVIDIFASSLMVIYVGLMSWFVLQVAIHQTSIGERLVIGISRLPVWPARWFAAIGIIVFLISILVTITHLVQRWRNPAADHETKAGDGEWTA